MFANAEKRSDVVLITSDIIFPTSYVVFLMPNAVSCVFNIIGIGRGTMLYFTKCVFTLLV